MKFEPEELGRSVIEHYIDEYIFNERDRNLVKRRMFDAVSFDKLAEEFDLSSDYTRKHYAKLSTKLYKRIMRDMSSK